MNELSNVKNKVNWDFVQKMGEEYGYRAIENCYGMPEICDPTYSTLLDRSVDIQPPWNIPTKAAVSMAIVGA